MYGIRQGWDTWLRFLLVLILFDILVCHVLQQNSDNDREEKDLDALLELTERELKQLLERKLSKEDEIDLENLNVVRQTGGTEEDPPRPDGLVKKEKEAEEITGESSNDKGTRKRQMLNNPDKDLDRREENEIIRDQTQSKKVNEKNGRELQGRLNEEKEEKEFTQRRLAVLKTSKRQGVQVEDEDNTGSAGGSIVNTDDGPMMSPADFALQHGMQTFDLHFMPPLEVSDPSKKKKKKRNFGYRTNLLWEDGIVPFRVEIATFSDQAKARNVIDEAVEIIERETCIQMLEINQTMTSVYVDHIVVLGNESGCWSWIGNAKFGTKQGKPQQLSLGTGCVGVGTALHEFLHALGMLHEQSRHDRDDSIRILFDNINADMAFNFDKEATLDRNPYDLGSVLQYGPLGFAISGTTAQAAKDPHLEFLMSLGGDLSFYDIQDINDGYQCTASCNLTTSPTCENGGFLNSDCECKCPYGLTGTTCGGTTSTTCGEVISLSNGESTHITSPNYPSRYATGTECVWLIKGEDNSRMKITLNEMDLPYDLSTFGCQHYVQIDYNLAGQRGPWECGAVSSPSPITYTTSLTKPRKNEIMIIFNSVLHSDINATYGFNATVEAFQSGCTSNPCQGGGTCMEGADAGTYTCKCYPGMSGQICDQVDATSYVSCGFESDTATGCFLVDDPSADMFWGTATRQTYKLNGVNTFLYAKEGSMFANFELYKPVNYYFDDIIFTTFSDFAVAERCLVFSYFLEDKTVTYQTTFEVFYKNNSGLETQLLYANTSTSNSWLEKQYSIPETEGLQLFFKGRYGQNKLGFDDVHLFAGPCDHPCSQGNPCSNGGTCIAGSVNNFTCSCQEKFEGTYCENLKSTAEFECDFEIDLDSEAYDCIFTNAGNDNFDWTTHQGDTKSINTGPLLAYDGVKYIYIEASSPRVAGDKARLLTDLVFRDTWYCMNLKYNMRGDNNMGTLSVGSTDQSGNDVLYWYKQGDQGAYWQSVDINIQMFPGRQIFIDGVRGSGWKSDIGIDSLSLSSRPCGEFVCDFESPVNCGLFDCTDCGDDFQWSRHFGTTASPGTGPSSARSGTYYLYAEMTNRYPDDTAKLVTKETFASSPYCLYFSYHMFGAMVGSLNIYHNNTIENGTMKKVWSVSGNQGDQWYDEVVVFRHMNYYSQIVIEAIRSSSFSGDIAIDDVEMTSTCPLFECTFELSDDACVLFDTDYDDFDWTTGMGPTSTSNTGPSHAAIGSYYKYIEASSPQISGQAAVLKSTFLTIPTGQLACLSFYYILNGSDVGTLTVEIDKLDGTTAQLLSVSQESTIWKKMKLNIQSLQMFQLVFKATVGSGERGDIAIDNVMLENSKCVPVLNCTFETAGCLSNVEGTDQFDWTRRSGETHSVNTGPSNATEGSYYTYIETSSPRVNGDIAILKADIQTLGHLCLTFSYHMYGNNIGTLDVKVTEEGQSAVTLLTLSGNKGDQWLNTALNFTTASSFELSFVGERSTGWQGDIAIDNVVLDNGFCT